MIAGRDLRHDAAVAHARVLRGDFAGQQVASAQDRDRGFIARGFEREDGAHTQGHVTRASVRHRGTC